MTAAVREYARRARCHADGSGKFSRNHSWKTEGNLRPNQVRLRRHAGSESGAKAYCFSTSVSKRSAVNFGSFRIVSKTRFKSALCEYARVQQSVAPEPVTNGTYPSRNVHGCVALAEDAAQDDNVRHPFDQAALFVEWDDRIRADVCRWTTMSMLEEGRA